MNRLNQRYQLTLDRVEKGGPPAFSKELVIADALPRHERRFTEFSGDVSGRYVGALAAAGADLGRETPALQALLPDLLRCQKPEGYFGEKFAAGGIRKEDMAILWGNGRMLIGLLEAYGRRKDEEVLQAAVRLGDFVVRIAPELNSERVKNQFATGAFTMGYICWTQAAEGMAELYRVTKRAAYLRVAAEMAARTERKPNEHSHGFLSSLRGVANLYEVAGERRYLEQVEREWQGVIDSGNLLEPGSIPEAWRPKAHRTEGCSEADWLRLSLQLWRLTAKRKYLDQAERTLFNEFAMNQFPTGDFGHRVISPTGSPVGGQQGGTARAWWCCTLHGLRAFPEIRSSVFRAAGDALVYDLPVDGRGKLDGLVMEAESALESDGAVRLAVREGAGKLAALLVREPAWAWGIEVSVNGARLATLNRDGYHRLSHPFKPGDAVTLKYLMRTRAGRRPSGEISIWHGPWLLGVDDTASPYFFDEPHTRNLVRLKVPGDGTLDLERVADGPGNGYAVPQARFRLPYLPGGYRMAPASALLRPVAEQTGMPTAAWEYWFRTEGAAEGASR